MPALDDKAASVIGVFVYLSFLIIDVIMTISAIFCLLHYSFLLVTIYLTILEAAPTVTICDGALESGLRLMAP